MKNFENEMCFMYIVTLIGTFINTLFDVDSLWNRVNRLLAQKKDRLLRFPVFPATLQQ